MSKCEKDKILGESRGYVGNLGWLEKMSKRYTQHKCNKCGLWHIWKQTIEGDEK